VAARERELTDFVDQLLFGYRDGHELLAASCRLEAAQLRDVMQHVDAAVEHDDERQLVGIWLPSLSAYLLAALWPAPERSRPGAVWAHALLLAPAQLARGRVASLLALLRRPRDERFEEYGRWLEWPPQTPASATPPPLVRTLTEAVRSRDRRPRIVLWREPAQAEGALVSLLDAAPAARRREISFRTRERARINGWPYRVQVAASISGRPDEEGPLVVDAREPEPG